MQPKIYIASITYQAQPDSDERVGRVVDLILGIQHGDIIMKFPLDNCITDVILKENGSKQYGSKENKKYSGKDGLVP